MIIGLGNPGAEYSRTRHNAGFMAIDRLADRVAPGVVPRGRFHALTAEVRIDAEKCLLMKPTMYMNRSGLAVAEAVRFYKVDPAEDVLVLVDDVALPVGEIRLRSAGGAGGHNGLSDISQHLGTDAYCRCRIGIDQPVFGQQRDYVLGKFSPDQWDALQPALVSAAEAAEVWVREGITAAMNRFNGSASVDTEKKKQGKNEKKNKDTSSRIVDEEGDR